jgi:carboxyl-terminal processing protease
MSFAFRTARRLTMIGSILVTWAAFSSCHRDIPGPEATTGDTATTFSAVFEGFWNGMNINYVFWDLDTTNWDRVYRTYKPLFANLNLHDSSDVQASVQYFRQMTAGLVDGHYTISFPNANFIGDSSVDPTLTRKQAGSSYHAPIPLDYFYYNVPQLYLDGGYVSGVDSTTTPGQVEVAVTGTIGQRVLYFYCSFFELQSCYYAAGSQVQPVIQYFFDQIKQLPAGIRGVVIDLRGNRGGDVEDLNFLLGRMITSPLTIGYTRGKNGNGRLDYSPWAPALVTPQPGAVKLPVPLVVLADNFSASLAEIATMGFQVMGGRFLGETTWGANGPLAPEVYFNDGQFMIAGIVPVSVYTSSTMFKDIKGVNHEGKGVAPDVAVPDNLSQLSMGDDPQLDSACKLLK